MDRGTSWATVHGVAESDTNDFHFPKGHCILFSLPFLLVSMVQKPIPLDKAPPPPGSLSQSFWETEQELRVVYSFLLQLFQHFFSSSYFLPPWVVCHLMFIHPSGQDMRKAREQGLGFIPF